AALVERLRDRGVNAVVAGTMPEDAIGVIFLGGLRAVEGEAALAVNREAFVAARAVAARFREHGGVFVTVQDTGGDFGLSGTCGSRAWLGGISALAKTAGEEWPGAAVKAIDVERGARDDGAIADALVSELLAGGPETEVGLRADGTRITLVTVPTALPSTNLPIEQGAVFVVSGGARGVTAASMIELARVARPRVLVLGRTALEDEPAAFRAGTDEASLKRIALDEARRMGAAVTPKDIGARVEKILAGREVNATLEAMRAAGATARYAAVDVRDPAALGALLDDVRRTWGPIRGLVHGAGVLADAFIDKKTDAQFDRVFDTKVLGLRALLDATQGDPIEWLCLFSSVAARAGNAGQADYAMANEVLNKVAAVEARRRDGRCRVVAIGWGPWDGGMVTPALRGHFVARGVALLPVAGGADAFVRELRAAPGDDVEVVIGGGDAGLHGARAPRLRVEVLVSAKTHPQLESHRIQGKPVLPMVLALEWFARVARALFPDRAIVQLRDVRVLRGVTLAGFDGDGDRLTIASAGGGDKDITLELRDANGAVRYAATVDQVASPVKAAPLNGAKLSDSPWTLEEVYSARTLFHGKDFQVIRSIEGISKEGASATLAGTDAVGWPAEAWQTDPAAVDGALQLAILCGLRAVGGTTLPLRIGNIGYTGHVVTGAIHCALLVRSQTPERVVCDIALTGEDGARIADLVDVEMYVVPSGTTAS
ncbi:MAG: SDR family oxidoreductase, partial [Deltaproteobacteria bacterium]